MVIGDHFYTGLQWKWGSRQEEIQKCTVEEKRKTRKFNIGAWVCDVREAELKTEASCALRLRLYTVNSTTCKMEGYRKLSVPNEKQLRQMKFKDRGRFQSKQPVEHGRVSIVVLD